MGATVADRNPFVSLIASRAAPLCTGSLVAPTAVLTTAACASGLENGAGKPEIVFVGAFNSFLDQFRRAGPGMGVAAAGRATGPAPRAAMHALMALMRHAWVTLCYLSKLHTETAHWRCRREGRYDIRQVAHVRLHPGWKPSAPRENNLALLLLRRPSKLQPVAVAGGEGAGTGGRSGRQLS